MMNMRQVIITLVKSGKEQQLMKRLAGMAVIIILTLFFTNHGLDNP